MSYVSDKCALFLQTMTTDVGIKRVLDGGFSYMRNYYATKILIETYRMKEKGDNPFHIGTTRYPMFAGNSWAFRYAVII